MSNGELIRAAEGAGYEVLITTDKGIHYQHNWSGRKLALVVLSTNSWPRLKLATDQVLDAVRHIKPAMIVSVVVPNRLS